MSKSADRKNVQPSRPSLRFAVAAEVLGTFMLVLFGCGAVHASALSGAQSGLWQVAVVWGISIMLACYVVGGVSGAHINPAITIAMAVWGKFPLERALPYIGAQFAGAFLAAAVLFAAWSPWHAALEKQADVKRGEPGSVITAMCFGEYYPNPGSLKGLPPTASSANTNPSGPTDEPLFGLDSQYPARQFHRFQSYAPDVAAWFIEVLGTFVLALVVCAVTDERNPNSPQSRLAPVFIGLTVAALVSIIAPLTQACFNPARDFGPRLLAYFAGWGAAAIPGPNGIGFLTVYIVAPIVGAILGVGLYERGVRVWLASGS